MTQAKSYLGLILTGLMVLAGSGCQSAARTSRLRQTQPQASWVTVDQLASRLNLRVVEQDLAMVTLKNNRNTVMLFKHDNSQFSVDGRLYGSVGAVRQDRLGFQVDASLVTGAATLSSPNRLEASSTRGTGVVGAPFPAPFAALLAPGCARGVDAPRPAEPALSLRIP